MADVPNVGIFDEKIWNPQVFGTYREVIPRTRRNELLRSGVLRNRPEYAAMMPEQAGGNYIVLPMTGRIGGTPAKYDGVQNLPVSGLETFLRGIVAAGFMKGWEEKDFTLSIAGKDFIHEIAQQVNEYWDDWDQKTIIAILNGIFNMTGPLNVPFVETHTTDLRALTGDARMFGDTTLNTATQKASGDNKNIFTLICMHSVVATNLENLNLMERLKYTDANGITVPQP